MAIQTARIQSTNTTVYTSVGETALTLISLCNHDSVKQTISMHIVPSGGTPGPDNIFISDLDIVPKDTFIVYQGGEKIILDNGDYVNVIGINNDTVTAVVSYLGV